MFGNLGEMANLLKKVKDIQKNMAELKAEMARSEYSAASADNEVVVVVSGDFMVKSVTVSPVAASRSDLGNIITCTANAALAAAKSAMQSKMQELSGGMNLPGLF